MNKDLSIGIMQPYFFPYLGHFALIANVDKWLVFDITQYTPKSWMNRNRILHPAGGAQYLTVALANSSIGIKTLEARIVNSEAARQQVLGKLSHYRRYAPYYDKVVELVDEVFTRSQTESLVELNVSGLASVCRYLGIPFEYEICSRMALELPANLGPGEWAPAICAAVGATEYLNPVSGAHLFKAEDFQGKGIQLNFLEYETFSYPVRKYVFEPNLSVLDVLMWNSQEKVKEYIGSSSRIIAG